MARESWTDGRLDDLNAKVDRGFEQVDKRFEQVDMRFERVDQRFEHVENEFKAVRREMKEGFDTMSRLIVTATVGICGSMITGFAAVIATQL